MSFGITPSRFSRLKVVNDLTASAANPSGLTCDDVVASAGAQTVERPRQLVGRTGIRRHELECRVVLENVALPAGPVGARAVSPIRITRSLRPHALGERAEYRFGVLQGNAANKQDRWFATMSEL